MSDARPTILIRASASPNGRVSGVSDGTSLDVEIEADPVAGSYQWFHFGVRARPDMLVRIVNAGASSYPLGWNDAVVWARRPSRSWRPIEARYDDGILEFPHQAPGSVFYALFPPYPQARLATLAKRVQASPYGAVRKAALDPGRLTTFVIGDLDASARQVWIVCGQHGNEHPAIWFAQGLVDEILGRAACPAGRRFHIVPAANPGGMRQGHLRTDPQGRDPNRHWGGDGPAACPEVGALLGAMSKTGVALLLDVHTDFQMGIVYLDVLDDWLGTPDRLSRLRAEFEAGLAARSGDVAYGRRYEWTAPPSAGLLAGMCAPAVERRFNAAAITLELPIGRYRDARDAPGLWSPQRSIALGRDCARVLLDQP